MNSERVEEVKDVHCNSGATTEENGKRQAEESMKKNMKREWKETELKADKTEFYK